MKNLNFIILIIASSFVSSYSQIRNDTILFWQESHGLTWDEYKGKRPDSTEIGAASYIGFEIYPSLIKDLPSITIRTSFFPYKSWKKYPTDLLLIHEQGHFDLAEVYSRKIRKKFICLQEKDCKDFNKYYEVYDELHVEYKEASSKYDLETNFGRNYENQLQWKRKISSQLIELNDYKFEELK